MNRGELVPDDVTIAMIGERLETAGLRQRRPAGWFPAHTCPGRCAGEDAGGIWWKSELCALYLCASSGVDRTPERTLDLPGEGHVYHEKFNPPQKPGVCDVDGSELYQREDDKPATVERRIRVYFEQTAPLIEYYRAAGLLAEVDGTQPIETVSEQMLAAIGKAG